MPTDFFVYSMTRPGGLVLIAIAIAIPFLIWHLLLGRAFRLFGLLPLAVAYASAFTGLLTLCFVSSYLNFSGRVALGLLAESKRWSLVPGWTAYMTAASLLIVLPGLALVCVPLAAVLVRRQCLSFLSVAIVVLALWLGLAIVIWAPQPPHRKEPLLLVLKGLLPVLLSVPVPFFLSLLLLTRNRQAELRTR